MMLHKLLVSSSLNAGARRIQGKQHAESLVDVMYNLNEFRDLHDFRDIEKKLKKRKKEAVPEHMWRK